MSQVKWSPERFATLNGLICEAIDAPRGLAPRFKKELTKTLEGAKNDLAMLFEYPPKDAGTRAKLDNGVITINGEENRVNADFIAETKKLSDFLNINESLAAAIFQSGQEYQTRYELGPGESAVILYLSERQSMLSCLDNIMRGVIKLDEGDPVREVLDSYLSSILSTSVTSSTSSSAPAARFPRRMLETLEKLKNEHDRIDAIRKGPTKDIPYDDEIVAEVCVKHESERATIAELFYHLAVLNYFTTEEIVGLVEWLQSAELLDPAMPRCATALLCTLNTYDGGSPPSSSVSDTQQQQPPPPSGADLVLDRLWKLRDNEAQLKRLNAAITKADDWKVRGLQSLIALQWSLLTLLATKQWPEFGPSFDLRPDRIESMAENAIRSDALRFASEYMLAHKVVSDPSYESLLPAGKVKGIAKIQEYAKRSTIDDEFQLNIETQISNLVACFITRMSRIIRNIRYREEDDILEYQQKERELAAAATQAQSRSYPSHPQQQQQQDVLIEPRRDTETLFSLIALLYADRSDAGLIFWVPSDNQYERKDRLLVFLRWGMDSREQGMIRAYFDMLSSLSSGPESSRHAHEYMTMNDRPSASVSKSSLCSWASLFGALEFYATRLTQATAEQQQQLGEPLPIIPEPEVALLCSFLRLLRQVALNSTTARISLYENQSYNAIASLFALLGCSVPVTLKAAIFNTLAAFCTLAPYEEHSDNARSATIEIARNIWEKLESAQALPTAGPNSGTGRAGTLQIGRSASSTLWQRRGGIAYELEELEAADETYPETRAFLGLLSSLIHTSPNAPALSDFDKDPTLFSLPSPSIPTNLGEQYRVPGINPYVGFVLDAIFMKVRDREYRSSLEKWAIISGCLDVAERSLATMDLSDFVIDGARPAPQSQAIQQSGGVRHALRVLVTHPGFEIAVRLLCGSRLLDELLSVISTDVEQINFTGNEEGHLIRMSVLQALRILLRTLHIQKTLLQSVVPLLLNSNTQHILGFPLNLPRSITTLDNLLVYRKDSVVRIAVLINATSNLDICLATVKILAILADSAAFSGVDNAANGAGARLAPLNRLVSLIDNSEDSVRIMHGFINCLALSPGEGPEEVAVEAMASQVSRGLTNGLNDTAPAAPAMAVRIAIMDLLIRNLSPEKTPPTISHWLLGFDLLKPSTTDLLTPDKRPTCFHAILNLLPKSDRSGTIQDDLSLVSNYSRLAERCYHLIYKLYSNPVTIDVVTRYLRNYGDFITDQVSAMPTHITGFDSSGSVSWSIPYKAFSQLNAQAWLFRTVAFELHTASLSGMRRSVKKLAGLLTSSGSGHVADDSHVFSMPSLNMPMKLVEHFAELWASNRNLVATLRQMRANDLQATSQDISAMYDPTSMPSSSLGAPLNVHQAQSMLNVDVNSCLAQDERGCFLYDLYTLLSLLRRSEQELELNGGIVSEGARTRVRLAIRTIMIAAFYSNQERDLFFAFSKAMNSWREVAEILVTSAWDAMGSKGDPSNMRVPLDLLSELLRVFIEASDELDSQQQEGAEMSVDGDGGALTSQDALGADFATRYDIVLTALSPALVLLTDKLQQGWLAAGSRQQLQQQAASGTNRTINNLSGMGGAAAGLSSGSQIPTEKHLAIWKSLISAALSPPAQRELPLRGNIYAAILHYLNGLRTIATKQTATDTVSSGAGGRYSLQKVARHQLLLGAVEILTSSSMGDRLLESLCQDAADAWDAWKTVAFSLLDGLANLYSYESRSRIVMFMTQRNYFAQYVGSLRREDDALQQTLDENPATLNPLYIYEAKMAFFIRLAQRRDGAEKLMENGIVEVLTDCKFLDSRIASVGAAITGALGSEAFIPSYFERYHQLFIPAINLMSLLATKVGKDNVTTLMKFAYFVTQHYAALEGILKQTIQAACSQIAVDGGVTGDLGYQQYQHQHQQQALAPSLTTYLLAQAKAVTTLVLHVSRHQVVVDRERSTAASGGVGIVTLHPYMMALLPKFGYSNKWANNLTPINETERLQAQVDVLNLYELSDKSGLPASISVSSSAVPLPSTLFTKLADDTVQTIVRNVLTYAQFTSESTNAHNPLAFWPAFVPTMGHARISDFMPSLATLVELMRFYVDRINQYSACLIEASRKLAGINQLTNAELKALLTGAPLEDVDSMTSAEIKDSVPGYLRSYQAEVRTKLASAYTSVQMATLLLWRHLDAFLEPVGGDSWAERPAESGFASDYQHQQQRPRYLGGMPEPSLQEREALHSDAIITLPSLLNSLSNINFDIPTATDEKLQAASVTSLQDNNQSALLRMLVRRIKDMVLRDESDIGL